MTKQPQQPSVVIVDDEDIVLSSLSSLLSLETDYDVHAFATADKALDHGTAHPVDVVVSDYFMPEMNGIDFLKRFREVRPQAPRVLLTGYADKENAIKAINEVGLFQYIEKPWDNDHLLLVLRNAIDRARLLHSLESKIDEINAAHGQLKGLQNDILRTFI